MVSDNGPIAADSIATGPSPSVIILKDAASSFKQSAYA